MLIRYQRLESSPFTTQNSPPNVQYPTAILLNLEPLSKYSSVTLHLSPTTIILHENPAKKNEGCHTAVNVTQVKIKFRLKFFNLHVGSLSISFVLLALIIHEFGLGDKRN